MIVQHSVVDVKRYFVSAGDLYLTCVVLLKKESAICVGPVTLLGCADSLEKY